MLSKDLQDQLKELHESTKKTMNEQREAGMRLTAEVNNLISGFEEEEE